MVHYSIPFPARYNKKCAAALSKFEVGMESKAYLDSMVLLATTWLLRCRRMSANRSTPLQSMFEMKNLFVSEEGDTRRAGSMESSFAPASYVLHFVDHLSKDPPVHRHMCLWANGGEQFPTT